MNQSKNRFDFIAPYYDRLASLVYGKAIKQAQECFVQSIKSASTILILGGGTGGIISVIKETVPDSSIWYIEKSATMIALAKKGNPGYENLHYIHGTELDLPEGISFDVVITHFFLDLLTEPSMNLVLENVLPSLKAQSSWYVADFVNQKWWQAMMLWIMYRFFSVVSNLEAKALPPWQKRVEEAGFYEVESQVFFGSFIKSVVYKRLTALERS